MARTFPRDAAKWLENWLTAHFFAPFPLTFFQPSALPLQERGGKSGSSGCGNGTQRSAAGAALGLGKGEEAQREREEAQRLLRSDHLEWASHDGSTTISFRADATADLCR